MVTVVTGCNDSSWHCMMLEKMLESLKRTNPDTPVEVIKFHGDQVASCHAKPLAMLHVQGSTRGPVLWLDCDMLIRKPLFSEMDAFCHDGLYIAYRPELSDNFKFNTGFVGMGYSIQTSQLIRAWVKHSDASTDFIGEQRGLWTAYDTMKESITLVPIHETFNDCHFHGQSHVWHAKGNSFKKHASNDVLKEWGIDGTDQMRH